MKNIAYIITAFAIGTAVFYSCNSVEKTETIKVEEKAKSLNPNGDSELALLMRSMYDEAEAIRKQIEKGEEIEIKLDHGKILSAHATEPEKAESAEFKVFGAAYLENVEELKTAADSKKVVIYKSMISNCMSCHQAICPGPMVRIKKLQKPFNI